MNSIQDLLKSQCEFNPQEWKQVHQQWKNADPPTRGEIVWQIIRDAALGLLIDHSIENQGLAVRKLLRINFTLEQTLNYQLTNYLSLISNYVRLYKLGCESLLKEINNFIQQALFRIQKSSKSSSKDLKNCDLNGDDNDYYQGRRLSQSSNDEDDSQIPAKNINLSFIQQTIIKFNEDKRLLLRFRILLSLVVRQRRCRLEQDSGLI